MDASSNRSASVDRTGGWLHGRIVLITGATSGIGRSLALLLNGRGAKVIVHGRSEARVRAVIGRGNQEGLGHVIGDLETEAGWCQVEQAIKDYAPDVLVLNAGPSCGKKLASDWTDAEVANMLNVNMVAPIRFARTFAGLPRGEGAATTSDGSLYLLLLPASPDEPVRCGKDGTDGIRQGSSEGNA